MTRIALVSCTATKLPRAAPARDLYRGTWFTLARAWAETFADRWYILSAQYGLVEPDRVIAPYDAALTRQSREERTTWAVRVAADLLRITEPARDEIIVLAGGAYRDPLALLLELQGFVVYTPLVGLGIGQQMAWLKTHLVHFGERA